MLGSPREYQPRRQHIFEAGDLICGGSGSREFWREHLGPQLRTCAAGLFWLGENTYKTPTIRQQIRYAGDLSAKPRRAGENKPSPEGPQLR